MDRDDIKRLLLAHHEEVRPYFDLVQGFNVMFANIMSERFLGVKKRTRIVLSPKLAFNLSAKRGLRNRIDLNLGVFPLVHALAVSVSKLDFVCCDIPSDRSFDQKKTFTDIADIFNALYYQIDRYDLADEQISHLLDESGLGSRAQLAYSLYKKMFYFLLCHEYVHIRCRHASQIGGKSITEFQVYQEQSNDNPDRNIRRHWAELEADHFGADLMVEVLRVFVDSVPGQLERPLSEEEADEIRQIIFVIGLLFLVFSYRPDEVTSIAFYRKCGHPHPCMRLANVFDVLANFIHKFYSIEMQSVINVMSDALTMLIRIAEAVGIREFNLLLTNLDDIRKEIRLIQNKINQDWIDKSNSAMSEAFITVRKESSVI